MVKASSRKEDEQCMADKSGKKPKQQASNKKIVEEPAKEEPKLVMIDTTQKNGQANNE